MPLHQIQKGWAHVHLDFTLQKGRLGELLKLLQTPSNSLKGGLAKCVIKVYFYGVKYPLIEPIRVKKALQIGSLYINYTVFVLFWLPTKSSNIS